MTKGKIIEKIQASLGVPIMEKVTPKGREILPPKPIVISSARPAKKAIKVAPKPKPKPRAPLKPRAPPKPPTPTTQTKIPIITTDRIMGALSNKWQTIKDMIFQLKIRDMMDARFLQIKLKELERKGQVLVDLKMGKKQFKLK